MNQSRVTCGAVLVAGMALLAGCAASDGPVRDLAQYDIEAFLETTDFRGSSFSPDKSTILVSSNETGVYNAFAVSTENGERTPLTRSTDDSIIAESYFPDDERIVYESDQGGNERSHVFVREIDGSVTDLTPGDELKAGFLGWSYDGESFFISSNERNPKFFDVYEVATEGYERSMIYRNDGGYQFGDISPDKRYLALVKPRTTNDSDIIVFDRELRRERLITEHEGEVSNNVQDFSPDGSSLYFTTDDGNEFKYLVRHNLVTGERETVLTRPWDIWFARFSEHGKYLVVGVNEDAVTDITVFEAGTMSEVELPELPDADITSVSIAPDERTMAFYVSSSRSPRDLYVYDLGSDSPRQLTRSLNPEIDPDDLVDARIVRFDSHDGVTIPGILYKPHQADADNPAPALVWVHGGPGGQSRAGYSELIQYLVNHGYVVYAINNRGSSGYGKSFYKMDDRNHGEGDLADCVASRQMLIDTGYVDPRKIGIIGGSYGGYMVLAALAFEPEAFEAGVDIFGVANWVRTLESIPAWWESFREALYTEMGDPAVDGERLHRISPLFHAGNITKPLMVLQGSNDPRVLKIESDEMVEAARANGAVVEYVLFEDEGHGFRKKANQKRGYRSILEFLDKHLGAGTPAGD